MSVLDDGTEEQGIGEEDREEVCLRCETEGKAETCGHCGQRVCIAVCFGGKADGPCLLCLDDVEDEDATWGEGDDDFKTEEE